MQIPHITVGIANMIHTWRRHCIMNKFASFANPIKFIYSNMRVLPRRHMSKVTTLGSILLHKGILNKL